MPTSLLPAVNDAVSGSAGTAISTLVTYPLDLVNTRLKLQRQLRGEGALAPSDTYAGLADALRAIPSNEGGAGALYAGLGHDVAKAALDSFLFFLFYGWFRARARSGGGGGGGGGRRGRGRGRGRGPTAERDLHALEELAVGAAAGACARLFTTPVANVVTHKQTAGVVGTVADGGAEPSVGEIVTRVRAEKGVAGLWSGYSAQLLLTLNPGITFLLDRALTKAFVPREQWDDPGAVLTFLLAAISKAVASAATYPFQVAKARMQAPVAQETKGENKGDIKEKGASSQGVTEDGLVEKSAAPAPAESDCPSQAATHTIQDLSKSSIFAVLGHIVRTEGVRALYDGIGGEILKGFFSHGTTMLAKALVQKLLIRLYFMALALLRRYPMAMSSFMRGSRQVSRNVSNGLRDHVVANMTRRAERFDDSSRTVVANMFDGSQRLIDQR